MPALRGHREGATARYRFESELPVGSLAAMMPFLGHALRIRRSLDRSIAEGDGVVSYELIADVRRRRFTVRSTWTDEEAFGAWVRSEAHVAAMRALGRRIAGPTRFDSGPIDVPSGASTITSSASSPRR